MTASKRNRVWVRWVPLALAAIALLLAGMWDRAAKETALEGFCPQDARVIAAAEDFGIFWAGLEQSEAWKCLAQEMGVPTEPMVLRIRQRTGIRPTPFRWSLWMGSRFLASQGPSGTGVCVFPGALLHTVDRVRRAAGIVPDIDGIASLDEYFYAWRDGFLIVSTSRDYVRASLQAPAPTLEKSSARNELRFAFPGFHDASFRVRSETGWPIQGRLRLETSPRKGPLTLAGAWPKTPICAITAPHGADVLTLLSALDEPLRDLPWRTSLGEFIATALTRWRLENLPADWDTQTEECSLAMTGVDLSETIPVPSLAVLLRNSSPQTKTHPLEPMISNVASLPYEWGGQRGVVARLLGEKLSLCLCRSGRLWLGTTNEPLMASLAGKTQEGDSTDADAALRIDWTLLCAVTEKVLMKCAELDLLPELNKADAERDLVPVVKGIGRLGTFRAEGKREGAFLVFNGALAVNPVARESAPR